MRQNYRINFSAGSLLNKMYPFFNKPQRGDIIIILLDPYKIKPRRGDILVSQKNILLVHKSEKMRIIYHSFGVLFMTFRFCFTVISPLSG